VCSMRRLADWHLLERVQAVCSPLAALECGATLMAAGKLGRAYTSAGRTGLAEAEYRVGRCYLDGLGVPLDRTVGIRWLERAAHHGHVEAQSQLAAISLDDTAGESDSKDASRSFDTSDIGDPDFATPMRRARIAAGTSSGEARTVSARRFRHHKGAARSLGPSYFSDAGIAHDPAQGMRWLRIFAASGDGPARAKLGNLLLTGLGNEDDRVSLYQGFEQAASGDPVAAYNCAVCLALGVGVARDDRKAALWLGKAADRAPNAQFWYGRVLVEGRGVDRNLAEGRRWIARAAEAGIADAQVALGEMMLTGTGGTCDPLGALVLFERAAANGHPAAMFANGVVYGGGYGVPADHAAARYWLRAAAKRGHPVAQMMLERYVTASLRDKADPE
jgi:TPR repeat protein